jgi:hypothetical protein
MFVDSNFEEVEVERRYAISEGSKRSTHYLSDTIRFDVSSKSL